jgi:hypothetical protein
MGMGEMSYIEPHFETDNDEDGTYRHDCLKHPAHEGDGDNDARQATQDVSAGFLSSRHRDLASRMSARARFSASQIVQMATRLLMQPHILRAVILGN